MPLMRVLSIVAVLLAVGVGVQGRDVGAPGQGTPFAVSINAQPKRADQYCEQTVTLPASLHGGHVVGFERIKGLAHHIIVSACDYDAAQHQSCAGDQSQCHVPADACRATPARCTNSRIVFVWAHGGEPLRLPAGVGVRVGPGHVGAVHLQVHYGSPASGSTVDHAGVQLFAQPGSPEHDSAVFLMVPPMFTLKPGRAEEIVGGIKCAKSNMHVFAVRVHAHSLGMENSFAVLRPPTGGSGCQPAGEPSEPKGMERVYSYAYSPQNPQSFVPLDKPALVRKGDAVAFKCSYDTHAATHDIRAGSRTRDEMCNVYLMYYPLSDAEFAAEVQKAAGGEGAAAAAAAGSTTPNLVGLDARVNGSAVPVDGNRTMPGMYSIGPYAQRPGAWARAVLPDANTPGAVVVNAAFAARLTPSSTLAVTYLDKGSAATLSVTASKAINTKVQLKGTGNWKTAVFKLGTGASQVAWIELRASGGVVIVHMLELRVEPW
eukprot:m.176834 g.176834  ORF g.176834 m.176834 type:complete len:488 (+) comp17953_c2_seq1:1105-2568(+)